MLHHRRRDEDLRRSNLQQATSSQSSEGSTQRSHQHWSSSSMSQRSYRTQRTEESDSSCKSSPWSTHSYKKATHTAQQLFFNKPLQESPVASKETLASTVQSDDDANTGHHKHGDGGVDLEEADVDFRLPPYVCSSSRATEVIASTPSDFSELFPSCRKLKLRHDDTSRDGNMNLRVDTKVTTTDGRQCDMTLYHLRMHDLRNREFSLRRYCRDSGREVCSTARKAGMANARRRPSLRRSLSNALSNLRARPDSRGSNGSAALRRNDSGYESICSAEFERLEIPVSARHAADQKSASSATTPIKIEFSNYAQVNVTTTSDKRYEFDYWGTRYIWKKIPRRDVSSYSFQLVIAGSDAVMASIVPSVMSDAELLSEGRRGGWVPPCFMWLADDMRVLDQKDVSEYVGRQLLNPRVWRMLIQIPSVIIATGLVALVDSAIHAYFDHRTNRRRSISTSMDPSRLLQGIIRRASLSYDQRPAFLKRPSNNLYTCA